MKCEAIQPFDSNREIEVAADASPYGVGAVLYQLDDSGGKRLVFFVSRTLTKAEDKYPQLEKEALALVYAVKKFHKKIYDKKFTLLTDHEPLTRIYDQDSPLPAMARKHVHNWAAILSAYSYDLKYRKSKLNILPDMLSRLPRPHNKKDVQVVGQQPAIYALMSNVTALQVPDVAKVATETGKDLTLTKALHYTQCAWPSYCNADQLSPYYRKRLKLSTDNNCLLWGNRVVIPTTLQEDILKLLHEGHCGEVRMKQQARQYCCWPNMDADISTFIKKCAVCQATQNKPPLVPVSWLTTNKFFQRIHIDFLYFEGKEIIIISDTFSRCMDAYILPKTDAETTLNCLINVFSLFGLPEEIVAENGQPFASARFAEKLKELQIKLTSQSLTPIPLAG